MGHLHQGRWLQDQPPLNKTSSFVRPNTQFHQVCSVDFFSPHRCCLIVADACPWAHRVLVMRALMGIEAQLPVVRVQSLMKDQGWEFVKPFILQKKEFLYLHQLYTHAQSDYTGRVTVPVLWDMEQHRIVNNESADMMQLLYTLFHTKENDLYPMHLRSEIDALNAWIYESINNGVYRVGFATAQDAYQEAYEQLFAALEVLDHRLSNQQFLFADLLTLTDWRLFTTLIRFDIVYYTHFKCNFRLIREYQHLSRYLRTLYEMPGIAETVRVAEIKQHYYQSHALLNPSGIVAMGPEMLPWMRLN